MPAPHIYASYFDAPRQEQEQQPNEEVAEEQNNPIIHILSDPEDSEYQEPLEQVVPNETLVSVESPQNAPVALLPCPAHCNSSSDDVAQYLARLEQRLALIEENQRQQHQQQQKQLMRNRNYRRFVALEGIRLFFISAVPVVTWGVILGASFVCLFHALVFALDMSKPGIEAARHELRLLRLQVARYVVKVLKEFQPS
ncbi:hypothetical protein ACA910_013536 [Epithemia clementina (nom. ined.)]